LKETGPAVKAPAVLRRGLHVACAAFAVLALAFAVLVVWHSFRPASSTLMLWRAAQGEANDQRWRSLEEMSPELARAVIAAEDQKFCLHYGVDWGALGEVVDEALTEDGPSRGASTVTMQTVKNLYLWPGRSYLRKALEIPMALIVDLVWSKRRIMEVYLNIAEWGDGVFGAEAAARRHFGKAALDLTSAEAARLVAALPNPRFSDPRHANGASRRIARRMGQMGRLADCAS
jgi:monofunctional glycosyltransferase